jgi:hypothetical protein
VSEITSDSKSSLKALVNENNQTALTGLPNLDQNIRLVKERCSCIVSSLPYDLPNFLIPWCVFVVSR